MLAARLRLEDKVGLVSPSTPVLPEQEGQFIQGIEYLKSLGLIPVPGEHVASCTSGYAAAPQEKAADIHRMFADPEIKAILCTQGGATANACLSYLDWDLIRKNPKIFLGISDITVLLNAIYVQTGLVTFHGNDLMWGFGRSPAAYDVSEFRRRMMEAQMGPVPANGPRRSICPGRAEGRLLGGNLNCLMKLAGTPYFPDFEDAILFMEALDIEPQECDFLFSQLQQIGVFDRLKGAIVGYNDGLQNRSGVKQMEDVLLTVSGEKFPILKVNDFGHNCPNTELPVGGRVRMDTYNLSIEIIEPYLDDL